MNCQIFKWEQEADHAVVAAGPDSGLAFFHTKQKLIECYTTKGKVWRIEDEKEDSSLVNCEYRSNYCLKQAYFIVHLVSVLGTREFHCLSDDPKISLPVPWMPFLLSKILDHFALTFLDNLRR